MSIEIEKAKYEQVWKSDDYRRFSPGLKAIQDYDLLGYIKQDRITSVLDVGCGSGQAMQFLMTRMPRLRVHGFDIAENCLNDWFKGSSVLTTGCLWSDPLPEGYELLMACDIFEHIPEEHVEASLANIYRSAKVSAFFGIALFEDSFGPQLLGTPLHLSLFTSEEWLDRIRKSGWHVVRSSVLTNNSGKPMWLYCMCEKEQG
jgi:hypothetical protein